MNSNFRFSLLMIGLVSLIGLLVFLGLRADRRLLLTKRNALQLRQRGLVSYSL